MKLWGQGTKIKHRGRGWAYFGLVLGGGASIAANVAHSYVRPEKIPAHIEWQPEIGAVVSAVFWPVALFAAIEILARVRWPKGIGWALLRFGGLGLVAGTAAIVSWLHMYGLLGHYGRTSLEQIVGPIAVDGLMAMATGALLAQGLRSNARDKAAEDGIGDKIKDTAERVAEKSRGLLDKLSPVPAQALAKDVPATVPSAPVPVPGVVLVGRDAVNGKRSPASPAKVSPVRDTVTEAVPEDKPKASPRKASPAKKSLGATGTADWGPIVRDMLGDADTLTKDMVVAIRDKVWPDMSEAAAKKRIQRFRKAEAA